jgi:arylsulfatase
MTAEIDLPRGGEGVLVTQGGNFGGYAFYLLKGRPVFTWNLFGLERVRWEGRQALSPGKHALAFEFRYDGDGIGKGGQGILRVDDKEVDSKHMRRTTPFTLSWDEAFNVGLDTGTSVDPGDYEVPFRFTGTIGRLTIELQGPPLGKELRQEMQEQQRKNDRAQ